MDGVVGSEELEGRLLRGCTVVRGEFRCDNLVQSGDARLQNAYHKLLISISWAFILPMSLTSLLINAQLWNPRADAPGSQLGHLVHKSRQSIVLGAEVQDNTQMMWQSLQAADILADELRGPVVVVDDREDAINNGMVGL